MAITNAELLEWLEEQATWIKDAAVVYYNKGQFSQSDIERFADECMSDIAKMSPAIDVSGLDLLGRDESQNYSLLSVGNIVGVNALAQDRKLSFAESGVTVVYGENGSGKSGYIRVLKKVCGARYDEELQPNVYAARKTPKQECEIEISGPEGTVKKTITLNKRTTDLQLRDIDIFDTKLSKAYVESAKEAAYEPWVFGLFRSLADASGQVKAAIEQRERAHRTAAIVIPDELKGTTIDDYVKGLNRKSKIERSVFAWSKESAKELETLKKSSNRVALVAEVKKLQSELRSRKNLQRYVETFKSFYSPLNLQEWEAALDEINGAADEERAARILFKEHADDIDDDRTINNTAWRFMWRYAKDYYERCLQTKGYASYTKEGGICPLCHQKLSKHSADRMKHVEEYINGRVRTKSTGGQKRLEVITDQLPEVWSDLQFDTVLESSELDDVLVKELRYLQKVFSETKRALKIGKNIPAQNIRKRIISVIDELSDLIDEDTDLMNKKNALLDSDQEKELQKKIIELESRKYAASIKDTVKAKIAALEALELLEKAEKLTASNKITTMSKKLATELITNEYIQHFNDELLLMTRGSIHVELQQQRAGKGRIPFKVQLVDTYGDKVSPVEVLSEGENRIVSLAAFFAEASGREAKTPLIVDDPISSLDYNFETAVIKRLVKAAQHRQVIVFTHRISMVVGLKEQCDAMNVSFQENRISGRAQMKGVPIESACYGGKCEQQVNRLKNENIAKLRKIDPYDEDYAVHLNNLCQQIRIVVEKSVEDVLLNGVVVRFRRDIKTLNKIDSLANISQEDCAIINKMMTKYSYYDHSHSDETPLIDFTLDDIEKDLADFLDWIKSKKKATNRK